MQMKFDETMERRGSQMQQKGGTTVRQQSVLSIDSQKVLLLHEQPRSTLQSLARSLFLALFLPQVQHYRFECLLHPMEQDRASVLQVLDSQHMDRPML
jgi:hypothetical protein